MNLDFPAVIKDIRIDSNGILATLDISPPDLSVLADLIDQEITITVSAGRLFHGAEVPASADEKLPFEPDASELLEEPRARKRRASSGRKRSE